MSVRSSVCLRLLPDTHALVHLPKQTGRERKSKGEKGGDVEFLPFYHPLTDTPTLIRDLPWKGGRESGKETERKLQRERKRENTTASSAARGLICGRRGVCLLVCVRVRDFC